MIETAQNGIFVCVLLLGSHSDVILTLNTPMHHGLLNLRTMGVL